MAAEITLNNSEEFQEMVDRKDFAISKAVVESILSNVNGRKKHVHVLSVNCLEEEAVFDITLERRFFIDTLQENLKYYVEQELYEECETIVKAIDILKEKQNTPKNTPKKNGKSKTVSDQNIHRKTEEKKTRRTQQETMLSLTTIKENKLNKNSYE